MGAISSANGVTKSCKPPFELNLGTPEEQLVVLNIKLALQPLKGVLKREKKQQLFKTSSRNNFLTNLD